MLMGRLFSWRRGTDFFPERRGSRVIWLIGAICFVIAFLGIAVVLLSDKTPEQKPQAVPAVLDQKIREPIKRYVVSRQAPIKSEKSGAESGVPLEAGLREPSDQSVEEQGPSEGDSSRMQDVLPEDASDKDLLSQPLYESTSPVLSGTREATQPPLSSASAEPPPVAENSQMTDKSLQPGNHKPISGPPSEVPDASPVSRVPPSDGPEAATSDAGDHFPAKSTVKVKMGNVREGPSITEKVVLTVRRGDTLQVTDHKGNWYAVRLDDGRSGWVHHTLLQGPSLSFSKESFEGRSSTEPEKRIQGIRTVVTDPNHAQIIFELNGYYPPEIMVLEGKSPRVVCDFFGTRLAPGVEQNLPAKTGVVKGIRVGVHKDSVPKVRVVLDLQSGQNYAVEQFFFEKENYYAIMVNAGE